MTITINDINISTLPIADLIITYRNQQSDTADMTLNIDYDADITDIPAEVYACDPPQSLNISYNQYIYIRNGSTTIFAGFTGPATRNPATNTISLTISGHWSILETCEAFQTFPFYNGSASTTQLTISGDITTAITNFLSYTSYTSVSTYIKLGTIDLPAIDIPETTFSDKPIASVLKTLLKYVPNAQVIFDYAAETAPAARIHILKPDSTTLTTLTQPITDCTSCTYTHRPDLTIPGVLLRYQLKTTIRDYDSSDTATETYTLISTDKYPATADPFARNYIFKTITLPGTRQYSKFTVGSSNTFDYYWFWRDNGSNSCYERIGLLYRAQGDVRFVRPNAANPNAPDDAYWKCTYYEIRDSRLISTAGYPGVSIGSYYSAPYTPVYESDRRLPPAEFWAQQAVRMVAFDLYSKWYNGGSDAFIEITYPMYGQICQTSAGALSSPAGYVFTKTTDTDDVISAPTGLAQHYYTDLQTPHYQGSLTTTLTYFSSTRRKLTLTNPSAATLATGYIQSASLDFYRQTTSVQFGPPEHLEPQDYLTLLTM